MQKIAILTSGGDGPGMNPAIRAVVRSALTAKMNVVGIYGGYQGILTGAFKDLHWHDVARIIHRGGTILGTGRYPEFKKLEVQQKAVQILREKGVEGLVVIGGDGSLSGALSLWENFGFPVLGIPGTIDNDLWGTDFALGTDTALNRGVQALDTLRDTAESHKRVFVMGMFGNGSGYLVTLCGLATGAVSVLVPEKPVAQADLEKLAVQVERWFGEATESPGPDSSFRNAIVLVAEGARFENISAKKDDNLDKVKHVHKLLEDRLKGKGGECRISVLGHIQRGGSPSAFDRILGTRLGAEAVRAIGMGKSGSMVGLRGGEVVLVDLHEVLEKTRQLQIDPESNTPLVNLLHLQEQLSPIKKPAPDKDKGKKLLVLTSADSPGINLAIRALVRLARQEAWTCVGANEDFNSLTGDGPADLIPLDWEDVHMSEMLQGGALLGTKRLKDLSDDQVAQFWKSVDREKIDGVVVFGGVHALRICRKLSHAPDCRPLVFIPATISNNIPGTDICIGADTALNNLVTVMDKCKDPGMALRYIQLIQTGGRKNGWLAMHAALAGGATAALIQETGVDLAQLKEIADYLRQALGGQGEASEKTGLILLNERVAEKAFSASTISEIMTQETGHTTRIINPGQMQRGGPPSAFDRILSCNFAGRAVAELDQLAAAGATDARLVGLIDGELSVHSIEALFQNPEFDEDGIPYGNADKDQALLRKLSRKPERE